MIVSHHFNYPILYHPKNVNKIYGLQNMDIMSTPKWRGDMCIIWDNIFPFHFTIVPYEIYIILVVPSANFSSLTCLKI